ncbi:YggT family protein [Boudabousia marimammalium]|uniref:YggT family protein n=1 Tax=Boudabousia marimammalium TaxID=156892 RepID=A0A1Q5PNS7_9ACTO|nr:YggT family protein [Boudabousia marimammalium]OKL49238.1 hypothetical protein BM477_04405 [Boudabousia marimammalium]
MQTVAAEVAYFILWAYTLLVLARFVFDLVLSFVPDWEPGAVIATVGNFVMALTDPPLRLLRRFIPPVKMGSIYFDFSLVALLLAIGILQRLVVAIS